MIKDPSIGLNFLIRINCFNFLVSNSMTTVRVTCTITHICFILRLKHKAMKEHGHAMRVNWLVDIDWTYDDEIKRHVVVQPNVIVLHKHSSSYLLLVKWTRLAGMVVLTKAMAMTPPLIVILLVKLKFMWLLLMTIYI